MYDHPWGLKRGIKYGWFIYKKYYKFNKSSWSKGKKIKIIYLEENTYNEIEDDYNILRHSFKNKNNKKKLGEHAKKSTYF